METMKKVDLNKVAKVSMLRLEQDQQAQFQSQLESMIEFVSAIEKFQPKNKVEERTEDFSIFRDDVVVPSLPSETVFLNAKNKRDNYFVVPIVVE